MDFRASGAPHQWKTQNNRKQHQCDWQVGSPTHTQLRTLSGRGPATLFVLFAKARTLRRDVWRCGWQPRMRAYLSVKGLLNGLAGREPRCSVITALFRTSAPWIACPRAAGGPLCPAGSTLSGQCGENERRGRNRAESAPRVRGALQGAEHGRGGERGGVGELREHQQELHPGGKHAHLDRWLCDVFLTGLGVQGQGRVPRGRADASLTVALSFFYSNKYLNTFTRVLRCPAGCFLLHQVKVVFMLLRPAVRGIKHSNNKELCYTNISITSTLSTVSTWIWAVWRFILLHDCSKYTECDH